MGANNNSTAKKCIALFRKNNMNLNSYEVDGRNNRKNRKTRNKNKSKVSAPSPKAKSPKKSTEKSRAIAQAKERSINEVETSIRNALALPRVPDHEMSEGESYDEDNFTPSQIPSPPSRRTPGAERNTRHTYNDSYSYRFSRIPGRQNAWQKYGMNLTNKNK